MSRTRYEWTLLDYASWTAALVPVPIYETSSIEQIEYVLNDADVELLGLVGQGLNNGDIGDALHLAPSTVKTYVSRLLRKTDSRSRAQLAARAHEWGVVVG